jgi:hypothetical protein
VHTLEATVRRDETARQVPAFRRGRQLLVINAMLTGRFQRAGGQVPAKTCMGLR